MSPAHQLLHKELDNGWVVTKRLDKKAEESGSFFSVGYIVEKEEHKAFLKALDFKKLLHTESGADVTKQISMGTEAFLYEKDILQKCAEQNLSKVIRLHDSSQIEINNFPVPYLIFELASSDVRKHSLLSHEVDIVWALKTIHSITVGLNQLHKNDISHQDLKPSNILILDDETRKIGDFGRSVTKDCTLPHSELAIAGGISYAPPEGTYGFIHQDWHYRRLGCDAYQLGGMLVFLLTGMSLTPMIQNLLPDEFKPNNWQGTYEQVLPYLVRAFDEALDIIASHLPEKIRNEVIELVRQLCHPNINERGIPSRVRTNQNSFSMEVYISKFNRLLKVVEFDLWNLIK